MNLIKSMVLVLAMSTGFTAKAQSFDWGSVLGNLNGGNIGAGDLGDIGDIGDILNGGDSSSLMDLAFNLAYMYASSDPKYAAILMALDIHSGEDLKNFLMNDNQNLNEIIAHLALAYADKNPQFSQWFSQVGVTDQASLVKFMKKSKYKSTVHKMALVEARGNDDYSQWLEQLGINDVSDIQDLLNGSGDTGSILAKLWPILENYVEANYPQYAQYLPMIKQLLGIPEDPVIDLPVEDDNGTVDEGDDSTDDGTVDEGDEVVPPEVVGAFRGLPLSEVKAIQAERTPLKKRPALNFLNFFSFLK